MTTERFIPSYEIPMPAITICSPLLVKKSVIDIREKFSPNFTTEDKSENGKQCYPLYWQSCNMALAIKLSNTYPTIFFDDASETLSECSHSLNETFSRCWFQRKEVDCNDILNRILTDYGYCFSVNMLDMESIFSKEVSDDFKSYEAKGSKIFNRQQIDWSLVEGYKDSEVQFPIRAIKRNQLQFTMTMEKEDITNLCITRTRSFGIIFHLPNEMPTFFHPEDYVEMDQFKTLQLNAKIFTADESLKKYSPAQRRCYFEGERKLKYFVSYTKAHCEFECLTNYTYGVCGCVKFSMPRTSNMEICNFNKSKCMFEADLTWTEHNHERKSALTSCNCLPTCFDIKYSVQFEKSSFYHSDEPLQKINSNTRAINGTFQTVLRIMFPLSQITNEEKFVAYRLQDFIADCGGLSGFFLGFSLLSIVDLFRYAFHFIKAFRGNKFKEDMNRSSILNESRIPSREENFERLNQSYSHSYKATYKEENKNIFTVTHSPVNQ